MDLMKLEVFFLHPPYYWWSKLCAPQRNDTTLTGFPTYLLPLQKNQPEKILKSQERMRSLLKNLLLYFVTLHCTWIQTQIPLHVPAGCHTPLQFSWLESFVVSPLDWFLVLGVPRFFFRHLPKGRVSVHIPAFTTAPLHFLK